MGVPRYWDEQRKAGTNIYMLAESGGRHTHGGGGDMEDVLRRVGALESAVEKLNTKVDSLVKEVAEVRGKLSNMPTTFQMASWFVGVAIGMTGLVFAIAKITTGH